MVKRVKWQYYFARKFSLQRFEIVMRVFVSDFFWKDFKVRLQNMLIKPEQGGNHGIWLDAQEYEQAISKIFRVVCRDLKTFHYYRKMIERTERAWVKAAKEVGKAVRKDLSRQELGTFYAKFIHWHQEHFNKPIWIIFPIEPVLSEAVGQALSTVLTRSKRQDEYDKWLQIIFSPEEKNAITKAHEAVLHAALKIQSALATERRRGSYANHLEG